MENDHEHCIWTNNFLAMEEGVACWQVIDKETTDGLENAELFTFI